MFPSGPAAQIRGRSSSLTVEDDTISASPQSLTALMGEIETFEQTNDDASFVSDEPFDELEVSVDLEHTGASSGEGSFDPDGQASLHSGKTTKTIATTSTQQSLSHSIEEGTSRHAMAVPISPSRGFLSMHSVDMDEFDPPLPGPEPVLLLGCDLTHLSPKTQFIICASGVYGFSLLYGFLQELLAVQICNRHFGLFLSMMQFFGYTVLSFILRNQANKTHQKLYQRQQSSVSKSPHAIATVVAVPVVTYLGLSLLRAVDLAMTNLAMQYINYPAKTLMKSSRVVFTMIFGVFILRKKYQLMDYFIVLCMVAGLAVFMHADATSSAVFQPLGVIMLTISLLCDGAITNMSETIMTKYDVGQDEFIFRMYSIALVAITAAAYYTGDLQEGMAWLLIPGTYDEVQNNDATSWSVMGKISVMVLFSTMGLLSSSCSAAITKHFGALAMSITSTARKATTVFLSFFLFNNVCTFEHIAGVVIFIAALTAKSLRRRNDSYGSSATGPVLDPEVLHRLKGDVRHLRRSMSMDRTPLSSQTPRRTVKAPARIRQSPLKLSNFHSVDLEARGLGALQRIGGASDEEAESLLSGRENHSGKDR